MYNGHKPLDLTVIRDGKEIKRNTTITNLLRRFSYFEDNQEFNDFKTKNNLYDLLL